ncbi:hypothetical protein [Iamia sp.]|uniref:hypothetical protein n=1 Tax=Iamia sp. TaxID=2722710 RepID=UPI002CD1E641|nr:hypothetical protein [Iamia sp.]HXH58967.1 hypothetical protein [Iamia sp.]
MTGRWPRLVRLLSVPVAWAVLLAAASSMRDGGGPLGALVGLGAVIGTLAVVGPWVTWVIGAVLTGVSRGPAMLLAGRSITDDPRGTYRTISGMVLAGLIAGFLFAIIPTISHEDALERSAGAARQATYYAYGSSADAKADAIEVAVVAAEPRVTIERDTGDAAGSGRHVSGTIRLGEGVGLDRVRTAVAVADPEADLSSPDDVRGETRVLLDDLGRASVVMSRAALAMAAASTAIGSAASIFDQRTTLARLRLVGTPIATLQRARRWQAVVPLTAATVGAMASGAAAGLTMMAAFGAEDELVGAPDVRSMALLGLAAVVAGLGAVALTRPVLVATSRGTPRE